jgi:hypothetical protein
MTSNEYKILSKFQKERNKIFKAKRNCFHPFCKKDAINSHVLQKRGFISEIAKENHVFEHTDSPYEKDTFKFRKKGINEVFTFKGYCPYHDNLLFKEIESGVPEFNDYKTNVLFGYRTIVQEIIKKENVIILFKSLQEKGYSDPKFINDWINGERLGIKDAKFTLQKLLENIKDPSKQDFIVHTREIKRLDVCASGIYTFETTAEQLKMTEDEKKKPLTDLLLNILPIDDKKSIVTIVYLKDSNTKCNEYYKEKLSLEENALIKFLSDVLIMQMENWIISPQLYDKIKEDEKKISDLVNDSFKTHNERKPIDYNIFK